jgi:hypothetical protein
MTALLLLAIVVVMAMAIIRMADKRQVVRIPLYIRRRSIRRR